MLFYRIPEAFITLRHATSDHLQRSTVPVLFVKLFNKFPLLRGLGKTLDVRVKLCQGRFRRIRLVLFSCPFLVDECEDSIRCRVNSIVQIVRLFVVPGTEVDQQFLGDFEQVGRVADHEGDDPEEGLRVGEETFGG